MGGYRVTGLHSGVALSTRQREKELLQSCRCAIPKGTSSVLIERLKAHGVAESNLAQLADNLGGNAAHLEAKEQKLT